MGRRVAMLRLMAGTALAVWFGTGCQPIGLRGLVEARVHQSFPPSAPAAATIAVGDRVLTLSWEAAEWADSYTVYWNTTGGVTASDNRIAGATSPYPHADLTNGITYYYVLTALNGGGESAVSGELSGTPVISMPSGLSAAAGTRKATLAWEAVAGADSYAIYWNSTGGVSASDAKIEEAQSPYTHTGLTNGRPHYYAVAAVDGASESPVSVEVSVTPTFTGEELAKLISPDPQVGSRLGFSVCISGDYAIVGAYLQDGAGGDPVDSGAAYIFHRTGTDTWDAGVKIVAPDAQALDVFGYSVSVSGEYAVVGAYGEDGGESDLLPDAGAAYVFHRTGTNTWDEGLKITASDAQAGDEFGRSASIDGDCLIVATGGEDGGDGDPAVDAGAAYIFRRTGADEWTEEARIHASDAQPDDRFGGSVCISGDYVIVSAWLEDGGAGDPLHDAGAAYIYHRADAGAWGEEYKIVASDPRPLDQFAFSASICGEVAVVGAPGEDGGPGDPMLGAGTGYVFHRTGANFWTEEARITASDAQSEDAFGVCVSIHGDYIIVGASQEDGGAGDSLPQAGAGYIFQRAASGTWEECARISASDAEPIDGFGRAVSISGDYALVGAQYEDGNEGSYVTNGGAAYLY